MGLPHHSRNHGKGTVYTPAATYFEWVTNPSTINFNAIGQTASVLAKVTDQFHVPLVSQPSITYLSGTTAKISISGGTLTSVANGTSLITAQTSGFADITGTATVAQVAASAVVSPSTPSIIVGVQQQFTVVVKDANNVVIASPAGTWSSSDPTDIPINSTGLATGVNASSAVIKWQAANGINGTASITVTASTGLVPSPSSFSGAVGATQQEAFTENGNTVTPDVIAYSFDPTIVTISSAPDKPTVGTPINNASTSLDIPVTGTGPYGDTPATVAVEVDENGTGTWVRRTPVAWTGNKTATQNVNASGLTSSKDYTGKIRAVTITAAGESYPSAAITSGATIAPGSLTVLPVTSSILRVHAEAGIALATGVSSWTDQSPTGAVFVQATGANQPAYIANAYNGKHCVRFSGSHWLATAAYIAALNPAALTLYIGLRLNAKSFSDHFLFSSEGPTFTGYGLSGCDHNEQYNGWAGNGSAYIQAAGGVPDTTTLHLLTLTIGGGLVHTYLDNVSINSNGVGFSPNTSVASAIGTLNTALGTSGNNTNSDIVEIVGFASAHSGTNRTSMTSYFQTEWGTP